MSKTITHVVNKALRQASETAEIVYHLVQEFFHLVHARQGMCLDSWIAAVEASAIPELQYFAKGLGRDKAAVLAGLTLVHSNGQVTRMKLMKRMMFGRAGFALLRQRILHRFCAQHTRERAEDGLQSSCREKEKKIAQVMERGLKTKSR